MNRRSLLTALAAALATGCSPKPALADYADTIRDVFLAAQEPALTASHGKLIRALRVTWVPVESGAPGINAAFPFGAKVDVLERALALLGSTDRRLAAQLIAESGRILPTYIARAQLVPGKYPIPADMAAYFGTPASGVGADGSFAFSAAHAKLLKGANWRVIDRESIEAALGTEDAWPMPYIDGKRPYGDMNYFQLDMASLLGEPYQIGADKSAIPDEEKDARLEKLHYAMTAALQVFLVNAQLA